MKKVAWLIPLWLLVLAAGFQAFVFGGLLSGEVTLVEPRAWLRQLEFGLALVILVVGGVAFTRVVLQVLKSKV